MTRFGRSGCTCAGALGEAVAGVILHGSMTLDDYVPGRSDVDLLVVIDDPLGDAQLAALVEAMASRRAEAPGPVDLRLVTRQVAASPTPAPPMEAYLRLTPRVRCAAEERRHLGERDLAVELPVCRAHGRSCWALRRDPTLGVVGDALRRRHRDPAGRIDAAQVQRLLGMVRARLAERATPPSCRWRRRSGRRR